MCLAASLLVGQRYTEFSEGQTEVDLLSVNMSHFPLSEDGMPPGPDLLLICGLLLSKPGTAQTSLRHTHNHTYTLEFSSQFNVSEIKSCDQTRDDLNVEHRHLTLF